MTPARYGEVAVEAAGPLLDDDGWVAQQKLDGTRCLAVVTASHVRFLGHGGRALAHAAAAQHFGALRAALAPLRHPALLPAPGDALVLDGELVTATGRLHVFDLPSLPGAVASADPLRVRRAALEALAPLLGPRLPLVAQAVGAAAKRDLLRAVREGGGEGVMLKDAGAPYEPGARTSRALKVKFTREADVVVTARDVGGSCNAELAVTGPGGELLPVGGCTMVGKHAEVGDVVTVRYLYWTGSRLYQPRMLRVRRDKVAAECGPEQLAPYSRDVVEVAPAG